MKCIVTGGGGFVGRTLATRLVKDGHEVHSLSRGDYPALKSLGIFHHRVNLSEALEPLHSVFEGADVIFHTAAKVDMWGDFNDFYKANVLVTRNLLNTAKNHGIHKFVFTSSPSVIADGKDLCGVDETYPYPKEYDAHYPHTKALAEQEVLSQNGSGGLKTISLRPHLIFGPGDTNLIPTILERGRRGKLLQIGDGSNKTDLTFIEDCVEAHILACKSLESNSAVCGRAYFISQGEPVNMWEWINEVLNKEGLPPVKKKVPVWLAMLLASAFEAATSILPGKHKPLFTKFLVKEMSTSHYFNISAAQREFGYSPKYTIAQAMERTFSLLISPVQRLGDG